MNSEQDFRKLLTDVIQKQIVILGPFITLAKARNVKGLTIADDGTVTAIEGNSQQLTQALIDQFMELSGLIVKKTMEPLLAGVPGVTAEAPTQQPLPQAPLPVQPIQQAIPPQPANPVTVVKQPTG